MALSNFRSERRGYASHHRSWCRRRRRRVFRLVGGLGETFSPTIKFDGQYAAETAGRHQLWIKSEIQLPQHSSEASDASAAFSSGAFSRSPGQWIRVQSRSFRDNRPASDNTLCAAQLFKNFQRHQGSQQHPLPGGRRTLHTHLRRQNSALRRAR